MHNRGVFSLTLALVSLAAFAYEATSPLTRSIIGIPVEFIVFGAGGAALAIGAASWKERSAKWAVAVAGLTVSAATTQIIRMAHAIFSGRGPW